MVFCLLSSQSHTPAKKDAPCQNNNRDQVNSVEDMAAKSHFNASFLGHSETRPLIIIADKVRNKTAMNQSPKLYENMKLIGPPHHYDPNHAK